MSVSRRTFLKGVALGAAAAHVRPRSLYAKTGPAASADKVIVLGMDGVDPGLLKRFIAEGSLPTF
jgi:hypothetical protein